METDFSEADLETGRLLFAQGAEFLRGVASEAQLPPMELPEIAFAGRSNVGKSSLVNALTGRKTLARTSNTPGRTTELNFFRLGDGEGQLILVDLPGYGYAKASRSKVEAWTELTLGYLAGRPALRRVMLLIDGRHGIKPNDEDVMKLLDQAAVSYQIVLTKMDKLKGAERMPMLEATEVKARKHVAAHPHIHATSSEKGFGIAELRAEIASLAEAES